MWAGSITVVLAVIGGFITFSYIFNIFDDVEPLYNSGQITQEQLIEMTEVPGSAKATLAAFGAAGAIGLAMLVTGLILHMRFTRKQGED
jgi:hypothetical protein